MAVGMHKMRLGRSLASLIGERESSEFGEMEGQRIVALDALKAGRFNPRRNFSDEQIEELAVSIRERGLVQPLVVRPVRGEHEAYEIVAGERRWRAAQRCPCQGLSRGLRTLRRLRLAQKPFAGEEPCASPSPAVARRRH